MAAGGLARGWDSEFESGFALAESPLRTAGMGGGMAPPTGPGHMPRDDRRRRLSYTVNRWNRAAGYAPGPAFLKGGGAAPWCCDLYARRMIRARTMSSATLNGVAPDAAAQRSTSRVMAPMRATEASTASGWSSMVSWWKSMTPPAFAR